MVEMAKAYDLNIYGYLKFLLEQRPSKDMTDEQLAELAPWSKKLQSIKNRMWIIVNYSNSQRAGVILNFTALIFGAYAPPHRNIHMVRSVAGDLPEQVKNNQYVNLAAGNGGQKMSQYSWFTVYDGKSTWAEYLWIS